MDDIRDNRINPGCVIPNPYCDIQNDCCGCEQTGPVAVVNQCTEEGCSPAVIPAPLDISSAIGIPILAERIYDCISVEDTQRKYLKGLVFTIKTDCNYQDGDSICIETITVNYDCIGLKDETISVRIDALDNNVVFEKTSDSQCCQCVDNGQTITLYNVYNGCTVLDIECLGDNAGRKTIIGEDCLNFYISNLSIVVTGQIGCRNFTAVSEGTGCGPITYSGCLTDLGYKEVDLFGSICLPIGKNRVWFEETFEGCLSLDCIKATQKYCKPECGQCATFKADAFSTLSIAKTIYATIKEQLIVYTNPGSLCSPSDITSNCNL